MKKLTFLLYLTFLLTIFLSFLLVGLLATESLVESRRCLAELLLFCFCVGSLLRRVCVASLPFAGIDVHYSLTKNNVHLIKSNRTTNL